MAAGRAADQQARARAAQYEQQAGQEVAASQRKAIEERRRARLLSSKLQARAGGGASDPGVVALDAGIVGEGEYRALTELYFGDERAAGLKDSAAAMRATGAAARSRGMLGAVPSIFSAGQTMWDKYGKSNPLDDFYKRGTRGSGD